MTSLRRRFDFRTTLLSLILVSGAPAFCHGQAQRILCDQGLGSFSSQFTTGVTVSVGASRIGGFGARNCDAMLRWSQDQVLPVATQAWQVDLDVLGADLGLGGPVVAFQIRKSDIDNLMTYKIYSLQSPPRLLRTINGGSFYDARDFDLQGHNEIWTNDAKAVEGFEGLPITGYDFIPIVVLRFEKGKLIDASSEYQAFYDRQIAQIKSELNPRALSDFKSTDGKLLSQITSSTSLHQLARTKIKVLEIVWAYLYSGREQQAWDALAEMWPPADVNRIREAIVDARAHGILSEVDGVTESQGSGIRKHHAHVFDMMPENVPSHSATASSIGGDFDRSPFELQGRDNKADKTTYVSTDKAPKAIFLGIPDAGHENPSVPNSEVLLDLVIDAAGKVQSAKLTNKTATSPAAEALLKASSTWNFIPAFKGHHAVACRIRIAVRPKQ